MGMFSALRISLLGTQRIIYQIKEMFYDGSDMDIDI